MLILAACLIPASSTPAAPGADRAVDTVPSPEDTGDTADSGEAPLVAGDPCDLAADACTGGARCCLPCCKADAAPVCTAPDPYGDCPLPDIHFDETQFVESIQQETVEIVDGGCAVLEGCVGGAGPREVIRFTTTSVNLGTADLMLGRPEQYPDRFEWSECHQHFHYRDYAEYRLLDAAGTTVLAGHKQAFCLGDTVPWVDPLDFPTYHCLDQGLSVGWADSYPGTLDCQWLDVTGIEPGEYTLELEVNPDLVFAERDYENNAVRTIVQVDAPLAEGAGARGIQ